MVSCIFNYSTFCHITTATTTTILWLSGFDRDNLDELVPEETFTHSHVLWSSIIPYLIPPSITIHGIFPVQLKDRIICWFEWSLSGGVLAWCRRDADLHMAQLMPLTLLLQ